MFVSIVACVGQFNCQVLKCLGKEVAGVAALVLLEVWMGFLRVLYI